MVFALTIQLTKAVGQNMNTVDIFVGLLKIDTIDHDI